MRVEKAQQIIKGEAFTFTMLRRALDKCEPHEISTTCSFFSKGQVREMIMAAINGRRGLIDPGTVWADYALWALVEFAPDQN